MIARHPKTIFIGALLGDNGEDLAACPWPHLPDPVLKKIHQTNADRVLGWRVRDRRAPRGGSGAPGVDR